MKQMGQPSSRETITCGFCGASNVSTRFEEDKFMYGDGDSAVMLTALVPVHQCASCSAEFTDDSAEDVRHDTVCHHLSVLTPAQIRELRERHNLSRSQFAKLTRLGEATIARWER